MVTALRTEPNDCPVSERLDLSIEFIARKALPEAVWSVQARCRSRPPPLPGHSRAARSLTRPGGHRSLLLTL